MTVNDDLYTELDCDLDVDDEDIMICKGPGSIKTGGVGAVLNFPWGGGFCTGEWGKDEIDIMDVCGTGSSMCVFTGACCPDTHECNASGCIAPAPPPSSDEDHHD